MADNRQSWSLSQWPDGCFTHFSKMTLYQQSKKYVILTKQRTLVLNKVAHAAKIPTDDLVFFCFFSTTTNSYDEKISNLLVELDKLDGVLMEESVYVYEDSILRTMNVDSVGGTKYFVLF